MLEMIYHSQKQFYNFIFDDALSGVFEWALELGQGFMLMQA